MITRSDALFSVYLSLLCVSANLYTMNKSIKKEQSFHKFSNLPEELQQKCLLQLVGHKKPSSARELVVMRRVNKQFQQLLQNQCIRDSVWQLAGSLQHTPLHPAAAKDDVATLQTLIKLRAPVDAQDSSGGSPLHYAVKYNHQKAVDILVREGKADVRAVTKKMATPLHFAQSGDVAKILVEAKADVNSRDNKQQIPLHRVYAMTPKNFLQELQKQHLICYLLLNGSHKDQARDYQGYTPVERDVPTPMFPDFPDFMDMRW